MSALWLSSQNHYPTNWWVTFHLEINFVRALNPHFGLGTYSEFWFSLFLLILPFHLVVLFCFFTANMEYLSRCNVTHNAVCKCKAGYECKDLYCKQCLPIPSTTTLRTTVLSTGKTLHLSAHPARDCFLFSFFFLFSKILGGCVNTRKPG